MTVVIYVIKLIHLVFSYAVASLFAKLLIQVANNMKSTLSSNKYEIVVDKKWTINDFRGEKNAT